MLYAGSVMREYTVEELAQAVQTWCGKHGISPANGQASEEISERTIRYYRTLGLLDAPLGSYVKTFGDKHRLQLIAIRVYQAQGIPLRKIREELYGKSLEDLLEFEQAAACKGLHGLAQQVPLDPVREGESWAVTPLGQGFLLVNRDQRHVPEVVLKKIQQLLASVSPNHDHDESIKRN
jgi:DNA-binding transcriptional MerR regulator